MTAAQRLVRLYMHVIARGRTTTCVAAAAVGTSRRTTRRDLEHLAEVAPISARGCGRDREWIVDPLAEHRHVGIADRLGLLLSREAMRFLDGTLLTEVHERIEPTTSHAPATFRRDLDRKIRVKQEPVRLYAYHRDVIDEVVDGLLRGRLLRIEYRGRRHGVRVYDGFEPLTLVIYRRALYLVGRPSGSLAHRRLAVDRMTDCVIGSPFEYPADWDPDAALDPWFGIHAAESVDTVVLEFSARAADYVERRVWHPTAKLTRCADGRVRLEMQSGGVELVRFALEWGPQCKVISPGWLVDAVRDELAEALEAYREPRERSPVARYPPASAPAKPAVRRRVCRST